MKKNLVVIFFAVFCAALFAQGLSTEIIKNLNSNVYEVVVKKINEDPLTYEKELPLDKLSYKERTDEYNSIGTAFYMEDGNFYTAFHVFNFFRFSQFSDFYIRSVDGKVYPVDKVLKFSSDRDFVEFSVKGFSAKKESALKFEKSYEMNSAVYSVGNAQGEGVVIRDGLLTSQTPEDRNGEWNWLRFSAAANPGNSGGPLINSRGGVIGIIVRKNSTENLNYALPITELQKVPQNKGVIYQRGLYTVPNIAAEKNSFDFSGELDLPKNFADTRRLSTDIAVKATKNAMETLAKKYAFDGELSFAKDADCDLMNGRFALDFPFLIAKLDNGKWDAFRPDNLQEFKLEENGFVKQGALAGFVMAFVNKGDSETVESMIKSPKKVMDNILKGSGMGRNIAGEKIKITSFGEPSSSSTYTDNLGRVWLVNSWTLAFCNAMILSYSLPVPNGIFVIYKFSSTDLILNGFAYDIPFCCDFIMPWYCAKFKEWKEYLSLPKKLYPRHKILADMNFSYDSNSVEVAVGHIKGKIPSGVFAVSDDDSIELGFSYFPDEKNGVSCKITGVNFEIGKNKADHYYAMVFRAKKVSKNASKEIKDLWENIKNKISPYNASPMEKDGNTLYFEVFAKTDDYADCAGVIHVGSHKKTIKKLYQKFISGFEK